MEKRILAAAEHCFNKHSIKKTKIDDICTHANISRPSFYRFFKNKQDLLLYIARREIMKVVEKLEDILDDCNTVEEAFEEIIVYGVLEFPKSETVRFMLGPTNLAFTLKAVNEANMGTTLHLEQGWMKIINIARAQGKLRDGFDAIEMMEWLQLLETLLIVSGSILGTSEEKLRRQIQLFVVPAFLKS